MIDATVGNGHDTLFLAKLATSVQGKVIGFDIQQQALDEAHKRLSPHPEVHLILDSHAHIDRYPEIHDVGAIIYNLGYLPGGEKTITTLSTSTLESIEKGLLLLRILGAIVVTCYSGHEEGKKEVEKLKTFVQSLNRHLFVVTWTTWENRQNCPSVLLIQKIR